MAVEGRKRRDAGDFGAAKRMLWSAIKEAVRIVEAPETPDDRRLKAISCLSTAIGVYGNLLQGHELERRLLALEEADAAQVQGNGHHEV
jgi:hypothetical protein